MPATLGFNCLSASSARSSLSDVKVIKHLYTMDPDIAQRAADIEETRGDNNNPPEATTGASSMADATGIGSGLPGDKITALELKRLVYKLNELSYGVNPDLSAGHFLMARY